MTETEAKNKMEELKLIILNHGYTIDAYNNFYIGDLYLGCIWTGIYFGVGDYVIKVRTNTRVIMTDKISFLKNRVSHNISIETNNCRNYTISDEKELKQFLIWEDLMVKHIKTALAKKRRMELDVDFE